MTDFILIDSQNPLYESTAPGKGWAGLVLGNSAADETISAQRALSDSALAASFIFAPTAPTDIAQFCASVLARIKASVSNRGLIWLPEPENPQNAYLWPLSSDGLQIFGELSLPLTADGSLGIKTASGLSLTLSKQDSGLTIGEQNKKSIYFSGPGAPTESEASYASWIDLNFDGPFRGCLAYDLSIQRRCLNNTLNWGFQYLIPNPETANDVPRPYLSQWFPLASGEEPNPSDRLPFQAFINPLNLLNKASYLTEQESLPPTCFFFRDSKCKLISFFATRYGQPISLRPLGIDNIANTAVIPARFSINSGTVGAGLQRSFTFAPEGDFVLSATPNSDQDFIELLCGLNGVETISLQSETQDRGGDCLRFKANGPAYVAQFPLPQTSPVGVPFDPTGDLLSDNFLTSYCTVARGAGLEGRPHYLAQPEGARMFGENVAKEQAYAGQDKILWPAGPGLGLPPQPPPAFFFPLAPFAGAVFSTDKTGMSAAQASEMEMLVLAPTRKKSISACGDGLTVSLSARDSLRLAGPLKAGQAGTRNLTTPSGVITSIDESDGGWLQIKLGQIKHTAADRIFGFAKPQAKLQEAFNTNQLCLVMANAQFLGPPMAGEAEPSLTHGFLNQIVIEDWAMTAGVGQTNRYQDYNNVLIVKSCPGKLWDLVQSPEKWTMAADFAAPAYQAPNGSPSSPDISQLVILSQWLQDYLADGLGGDEDFYGNFKNMIQDEDWSGVIVLKADIAAIPRELAGLTAGIDKANFYAHHFSIRLSTIDGEKIDQQDSSAMYGLIDYTNPRYDPRQGESPVQPEPGDYDFKILKLQTLFENTAVAKFYSLAQLTVNRLFGDLVTGMGDEGNSYNAIMLKGSYQDNNGTAVYNLSSSGANHFKLSGNVLTDVQISQAQLTTLDAGGDGLDTLSRFNLSGYLTFAVPAYEDQNGQARAVDLFSFGAESGQYADRQGLFFSGLGLKMRQPANVGPNEITFDASTIAFNTLPTVSRARAQSLYSQFNLQLQALVWGDQAKSPQDTGYLPVIPDCRLNTLTGKPWYGLRYRLNLGTPGALAGKLNFTSEILLAWMPGSGLEGGTSAFVGLRLPGAGGGSNFFSLQNILKLSVGTLRLVKMEKERTFMLLMSEIALKLFGLAKLPPNGATAFYLFGDPAGKREDSGLGWYAVYNQNQPEKAMAELALTEGE